MSKIEKALLKMARTAGNAGSVPNAQSKGRQLVQVAEPDITSPTEFYAGKAIKDMREERILSRSELARHKIIYPEMDDSRMLEAFREIRTKIIQKTSGRNSTVMITSLSKNSGNTFVSVNLAVAITLGESKTALLIDCNHADPLYYNLISLPNSLGLTDYYENDDLRVEQIIYPVGVKGLRLIPVGGKHNVALECFTSMKIREFLHNIKQRYQDRFIIIDAPPIVQSADVRVLAEISDYVLLVVPYGKVTESRIMDAANAIGVQKLLGVIFNNEPQFDLPRRKKLSN